MHFLKQVICFKTVTFLKLIIIYKYVFNFVFYIIGILKSIRKFYNSSKLISGLLIPINKYNNYFSLTKRCVPLLCGRISGSFIAKDLTIRQFIRYDRRDIRTGGNSGPNEHNTRTGTTNSRMYDRRWSSRALNCQTNRNNRFASIGGRLSLIGRNGSSSHLFCYLFT